MKICCDRFHALLDNAGQKGTSIIASNIDERRRFFLQTRIFDVNTKAVNYKDENGKVFMGLPHLIDQEGISIPFASFLQLPIFYCPGCGANLTDIIDENREAFDELAYSMKILEDG